MSKVLVIGSGGRCDAICLALSKSEKVKEIYACPGNPGMARYATCVDIKVDDVASLVKFAKDNSIDLTVVGPEASLAVGVVDEFRKNDLKIFGPTKVTATIESSKAFAKDLMKKYNIPTAMYETFSNFDSAVEYAKKQNFPLVLKYDGLAAGKGVVIVNSLEEAIVTLKEMLVDEEFGKGNVVIEEFLVGKEFSFMCLVNEDKVYPLVSAQDHKRAFDNDLGPNTGGMGAYTGLAYLDADDEEYALENIMKKTARALVSEGVPFTGILYGGLMKTADGIKVIEFNARFGDPETEVVLPLLDSDFYQAIIDVLDKKDPILTFSNDVTFGVVLASNGYPGKYQKGFEITIPSDLDVEVFHMGTTIKDNKLYTAGGRVLMVVSRANNLKVAKEKVYLAVEKIKCDNFFYRKDIGHDSL